MDTEFVYIIGVVAASGVGVGVSVWLYSDDATVSTRLFAALVALHSVVGVLVVGQLLASDPLPIYGVQKAVAAGIMPLWFLFALTYTRRPNGLSRPALSAVGGYYIILAVLEVTNPVHRLLRSEYDTVGTLIPHLEGTPTLLYSLVTVPLTLFYFAGLSLVGIHALNGPKVSRQRSAFLFVGFLPPFGVLLAGIYETLPGPVDGGLVIASTFSLTAVAWAVFRARDFELIPLARKTVFEVIEDAVIVVTDDLRLLDYNDTATEAFPQIDGEHGSSLTDLVPELVADGGNSDPFTTSFTLDENGESHYETTVAPLKVDGEIRGYGLVARDVTENRTYMDTLEQQTERLERFASTLSHDLRNPLNVAQLRTEMLVREYNDENAETVQRTLDRMETMIADLLILARSGKTVETTKSVSIAAVASEAWHHADTEDCELDLSVPSDATIQADRDRLLHVFENLFRNAADHNDPPLTVRVGTLRGSESAPGGEKAGFFVEDDGEGIPEDDREEIFEHGYTTNDDGTGFGLSIVHDIVAAHDWEIRVTDGHEGGARFEISSTETDQ